VAERTRDARGRHAERLCVWQLRLTGWRILARRFRSPVGEIDIVARRGRTVAFIEVKARAAAATAAESLSTRQRQRISRAAAHFLKTRPEHAEAELRFDVMLVAPWRLPLRLADAWRESG
jgi:putative endonuclease